MRIAVGFMAAACVTTVLLAQGKSESDRPAADL